MRYRPNFYKQIYTYKVNYTLAYNMYHCIDDTVQLLCHSYAVYIRTLYTYRKNTPQVQLLATPYDYVDVSRQEHVNNRHFLSKLLFRVLLANT